MGIYIGIKGIQVAVREGATAELELINPLFADGMEDGYSLPIEVPRLGNEAVFNHVAEPQLLDRVISYPGASIGPDGNPLFPGSFEVLATDEETIRGTFLVQALVNTLKGIMLPDTLKTEVIDIIAEGIDYYWNFPDYENGGPCQFPLYENTALYGDTNKEFYPENKEYKATETYDINDLVRFTETSPVMHESVWQCTDPAGTAPGQNPTTHPGKWRRAAFGLVNAWDKNTFDYHQNVTNNFYTWVPWFYLKWVLKKALAFSGYQAIGQFMDDPVTHEMTLPNNTTTDVAVAVTSNYFFEVSQNAIEYFVPVIPTGYWWNNGWQAYRLPAQTEVGGTNQDPDNLWDPVLHEWTCPAAGVFRFHIHVEHNRRSHSGDLTVRTFLQNQFDQILALAAQQAPAGTTLPIADHSIGYLFTAADIGQKFHFCSYQLPSNETTLWPQTSADHYLNVRIRGWLEDLTPAMCKPDTVILPHRHVPDIEVSEFVIAVADAYNLEIVPDEASRTVQFNYKESVLADRLKHVTDQSHRSLGQGEIDHQRSTTGIELAWDMDDVEDRTDVDPDLYHTEFDLPQPFTTGLKAIVRNSRKLYKSIFENGIFAWKQFGYDVPKILIGDDTEPKEIKPGLKPLHMKRVHLDGEIYMAPVMDEEGRSDRFHTEGKQDTIYICEYKRADSYSGAVYDIPAARTWGWGWTLYDYSRTTLNWQTDDVQLPGMYQRCWRHWAGMLTTAEPVIKDLLVDSVFLRSAEWRRTMHMNGQHYLLERMPLELAAGNQPLISEGAFLFCLRPNTSSVQIPATALIIPQYFTFKSTKDNGFSVISGSTTGYVVVRDENDVDTVHGTGVPNSDISVSISTPNDNVERTYRLFSSDATGTESGGLERFKVSNEKGLTYIETFIQPDMTIFNVALNAGLIHVEVGQMQSLYQFVLLVCPVETLILPASFPILNEFSVTNMQLGGVGANDYIFQLPDLPSATYIRVYQCITLQKIEGPVMPDVQILEIVVNDNLSDVQLPAILPACGYIYIQDNPTLMVFNTPEMPWAAGVYMNGNSFNVASVDNIFINLLSGITGGTFNVTGFLMATPTVASSSQRTAYSTASWSGVP